MKKTILKSSRVVKRAVKTVLASGLVLTYFSYMSVNHLYDYMFMAVFLILIYRYFAIED